MAAWCLVTGQTPDTYTALTLLEREAFIDMARKANQRRR